MWKLNKGTEREREREREFIPGTSELQLNSSFNNFSELFVDTKNALLLGTLKEVTELK